MSDKPRNLSKHELDSVEHTIGQILGRTPPWIASALAHLALLGLFAQITAMSLEKKQQNLVVSMMPRDEGEGKLDEGNDVFDSPLPGVAGPEQADISWDESTTEVPGNASAQEVAAEADVPRLLSIYGQYGMRGEGGRGDAVRRGGGTGGSEKAVDFAIEWLQRHQGPDGGWHARTYTDCCMAESKCTDAKDVLTDVDSGLTALAVLTFLGRNYTDQTGPYKTAVEGGLRYILKLQTGSGSFGTGTGSHEVYNHALCTLAVCEAYGMTHNARYRLAADRAIKFILKIQASDGGWGYVREGVAGFRSDMSVTGWQVMALKSAELSDIKVPPPAWKAIIGFTNFASNGQGLSGYLMPNQYLTEGNPSTIAVGLVCRQFAPIEADPKLLESISDSLAKKLPDPNTDGFFYYSYYGSLGLFQYGGPKWRTWNDHVRKLLADSQKKQGCEAGSWDPGSRRWASWVGRLYSTTMAALTLEVYYRYLPVHRSFINESREMVLLRAYRAGVDAYRLYLKLPADAKQDEAAQAYAGAVKLLDGYRQAEAASGKPATEKDAADRESRLAATAVRLATVHFRAKNYTQCVDEVKDFAKRYPRYQDQEAARKLMSSAMALLARNLDQQGDTEQADRLRRAAAEEAYRQIVKDANQPLSVYQQVADDFWAREDWLRAGQMLAEIIDRFANDPQVQRNHVALRLRLAKCMVKSGVPKDAVKLLEELRAAVRSRSMFELLAEAYTQAKDFQKAMETYVELRRGSEAGSDEWWQAQYGVANALLFAGRAKECESLITVTRELHPQMGGEKMKARLENLLRACRQIREESGRAEALKAGGR